jgi:hypothetical protein
MFGAPFSIFFVFKYILNCVTMKPQKVWVTIADKGVPLDATRPLPLRSRWFSAAFAVSETSAPVRKRALQLELMFQVIFPLLVVMGVGGVHSNAIISAIKFLY